MKSKKKENQLRKRLLAALTTGFMTAGFMVAHLAPVAYASDWETPEYLASNGLDIVNAAAAYDQGYTGRGITMGVCDQPINFAHPDFSGKKGSSMLNTAQFTYGGYGDTKLEPPGVYDWSVLKHGTHVAGIAAASRDGAGMHGVAFDADVAGTTFGQYFSADGSAWEDEGFDPFAPYYSMEDVKVINNSWGSFEHLDAFGSLADFRDYCNAAGNINNNMCSIKNIVPMDKLLIFAACNAGYVDPQLFGAAVLLDKSVSRNLISVSSLDDATKLFRNGGSISGAQLMNFRSCLATYVEDNTIAAPGRNILSCNANFAADGQRDIVLSGTSMATPFVAGGAALVQQAFPYLGGKQIGDVLLSTANSNVSVTNGYVVMMQYDAYDPENRAINILYTDPAVISKTPEQQKADIEAYIATQDPKSNEAKNLSLFIEKGYPVNAYYHVPMQALVGQGVLDVGKAVRGPGALNARRLTSNDISNTYTVSGVSQNQAMYRVDTKGYDSVWSNDIKEVRVGLLAEDSTEADLRERYKFYKTNWLDNSVQGSREVMESYIADFNRDAEASGLLGLHVGLLKEGEGRLSLTGTNTYQGASIAAGGTLSIDGSVAGDAYSVEKGIIAGRGTINGTLYNRNISVAGDTTGTGNLRMGGLVSSGVLESNMTKNGNTKFVVTGDANIDGSTVKLKNALPGEGGDIVTAVSVTGNLKNASTPAAVSGMLGSTGTVSGNTVKVNAVASNNLGTTDGTINETFDAMTAMDASLIGDPRREEMRPLFNLDAGAAKDTLASISSAAAAQSLSTVQRSQLTEHLISSRLAEAFVQKPVNVKIPVANLTGEGETDGIDIPMKLDQPAENDFWFKTAKNWGDLKGGAYYNSTAFALGWDKADGKMWRLGTFISHGTTSFADTGAHNDIKDTRFGFYGGYSYGPHTGYVYMDYGWLKNDLQRSIPYLGLTPKADYDSRILELGGEYKYDLNAKQKTPWHFSPYANVQLSRLWQDGYTEQGAGIFGQRVSDATNTYFAGAIGIECKRYLTNGSYALRLGVKHAFAGSDPRLTFGYVGDNASSYEMKNEQDKTHFVMSVGGEAEFAPGWWLAGDAMLQKGAHDKDVMCALTLRRVW
ncbi:S8 family serine peptidase [Anaerovibrio sp. RM50]|uniref:S8 family serine peptidase n=1 Tax=Anaerovibrio sp. RM50 TaxID=1200557 RepID=UPI0004884411|nr:S8 family serine peptidase [Anaerovibrio sp. RM50]